MRRIARIARGFIYCFLGLIALDFLGILGLTYPRARENQPLENPIGITEVREDSLLLEDGRIVKYRPEADYAFWSLPHGKSFTEYFAKCRPEIELAGPYADDPELMHIKAAEPTGLCGTPWIRMINIPLIPTPFSAYTAKTIAYGAYADLIEGNGEQSGAR